MCCSEQVDWMIEVTGHFKMEQQTLHLAVKLLGKLDARRSHPRPQCTYVLVFT
jgi:hypothetical protein